MFRPAQPGDWAADDDDDIEVNVPDAPAPPQNVWAARAAAAAAVAVTDSPSKSEPRSDGHVTNRWTKHRQEQENRHDRRQEYTPRSFPVERGVVIALKENFGFVSCADRPGDLYFSISEAPMDLSLHDEVEFQVMFHRDKESCRQLRILPKGSIQWEDISTEYVQGVVTKGLPRGQHGRDEGYGLITVQEDNRRVLVRYTNESSSQSNPHMGDQVRFHLAIHRKTGTKRAIDLEITCSALEKWEQEMNEKLAASTREEGMISKRTAHGGWIRCCERKEDVAFTNHEIRKSIEEDTVKIKGHELKEGDEVSFYLYEPNEMDPFYSAGQRMTALRLVKLPKGTISFQQTLATEVQGTISKIPRDSRYAAEVMGTITSSELSEPVCFRLCDVDHGYQPMNGDQVCFEHVRDRRTQQTKAIHVSLVSLNPIGREVGTISVVREDFGFIKCLNRSQDAYFRLSDVMTGMVRAGDDVSFDVSEGNKQDSLRATRLQVLPPGSVQWELELETQVNGEIVSLPSKTRENTGGKGGRIKPSSGRIQVRLSKLLIEYFEELKQEIDQLFILDNKEMEAKDQEHVFSTGLTKYERAALHEYCEILGLSHQSIGEGIQRCLRVHGKQVLVPTDITIPSTRLDFEPEEIVDVRYRPRPGDRIQCSLIVSKRTQTLVAKRIVFVKEKSVPLVRGQGWIVTIKSDGFGFIANEETKEHVFFLYKDLDETPQVGMEVEYELEVDEKKKKSKAIHIHVLPKGTLQQVTETFQGSIIRASILQRFQSNRKSYSKQQSTSSVGRISVVSQEEKKKIYTYFLSDIQDPTTIVREGDQVEFIPQAPTSTRATQIRLIQSHAKQGLVIVATATHGKIQVDGEESLQIPYRAKHVLRGDLLQEGDRVEFAIRPKRITTKAESDEVKDEEETKEEDMLDGNKEDSDLIAVSILCLTTNTERAQRTNTRPTNRVNSSLRLAMQQAGATASAASHMAKGPDGSKGFKSGWRGSKDESQQ